jgi:hypothetical protein
LVHIVLEMKWTGGCQDELGEDTSLARENFILSDPSD